MIAYLVHTVVRSGVLIHTILVLVRALCLSSKMAKKILRCLGTLNLMRRFNSVMISVL